MLRCLQSPENNQYVYLDFAKLLLKFSVFRSGVHFCSLCVCVCVVNYQLVPLLFNCYKHMYWIFPAFSLDKLSMHSQTLLSVGREKKCSSLTASVTLCNEHCQGFKNLFYFEFNFLK